jgi:hydrogenase maturation protease
MNAGYSRLLVGLGSPFGDDRLGWHIAKTVQGRLPSRLEIRLATTPIALMDWLEGVERLMICDACQGGGCAGSARVWHWPDEALAPVRFSGSHDLGLAAVLRLADQLGILPPRVMIWAIEGKPFSPLSALQESGLSSEVLAAVPAVVESIENELR